MCQVTRLGSRAVQDFLFEIADDNIQGTPREKVRLGVMKARMGQLPIRGGAREVSHSHAGKRTTNASTIISAAALLEDRLGKKEVGLIIWPYWLR